MNNDLFDFEQQIMDCWNVTKDIRTLFEAICENDGLSKDDIENVLLGISALYELKFNKLWNQFEHNIVKPYWAGIRTQE